MTESSNGPSDTDWEAIGPSGSPPSERGTRPSKYLEQLELLEATYGRIRTMDLSELVRALSVVRRGQAMYVGSGGALAVAHLAAELHQEQTRTVSRAVTPLELMRMPTATESSVVLFTASGRHPDALATVEAARRARAFPIVVVTQRRRDQLPHQLADPVVEVVTLPSNGTKEGFLATNSVMAMAAAIVKAVGFPLPKRLPHFRANGVAPVRPNTLVLSGPGLASVGVDLETRFAETGLTSVQVTDYRNFAHGRHTGLARRLDETTVVALVTPELRELAAATLATLPARAEVVALETTLAWPFSALDLLVASMKMVAATAAEAGLDPSRPTVPAFGRRLYHLSSRRFMQEPQDPVERKLAASGLPSDGTLRRRYERFLDRWKQSAAALAIGGVVFDYDGTVCATADRFDLPSDGIQARVLELLEAGAVVGFASGRGKSLYRDLRKWIPKPFWRSVELGLYNGGLRLSLADPLAPVLTESGAIREAEKRVRTTVLGSTVRLERRPYQLSIAVPEESAAGGEVLVRTVLEAITRSPALDLKVVASAHSVDVIPADTAKTRTLEVVKDRVADEVIAFGDQGQVGGNDFELLAATRWSLSVDRVSGDPTRCWNLDRRGESGPLLLERYLNALKLLRKGPAFRWKD